MMYSLFQLCLDSVMKESWTNLFWDNVKSTSTEISLWSWSSILQIRWSGSSTPFFKIPIKCFEFRDILLYSHRPHGNFPKTVMHIPVRHHLNEFQAYYSRCCITFIHCLVSGLCRYPWFQCVTTVFIFFLNPLCTLQLMPTYSFSMSLSMSGHILIQKLMRSA